MKTDIQTLLDRGTVDVIIRKELEEKIKAGKNLRVKLGIDPTGSDLHIGHAVVLKKLRHFQDAGHTAVLIIGDYTARVGDPTGKSETRVMLTAEQIEKNMKYYIKQAAAILDMDKLEIRYNSEWFSKMNMGDILELTAKKTINQMIQREDFKNRIQNDQDVSMVETLYPLMQGYDSVMLNCDVEIGGTDQLFNMMVGRDLQKRYNKTTIQNIITVPILEGLDGVEKMSKSLNNYIGINDEANEMYGKTLSIPDDLITKYFELATNIPMDEIKKISKRMEDGENPKTFKMQLARELVKQYHNEDAAKKAEEEFENIFKNKGIPEDIETITFTKKSYNIIDLISESGLAQSKSEARRLVEGGGVKIDSEKIPSIETEVDISTEKILQVGKRKFVKVISK
ncbi:tyrosine--tRNA ligase [Candidatus Peregrinibacteria bacterium CG10_big_fil_rev_8_21_14_0_10_36_19]|nr:MAG: tyrosine--tRNA ligase [Candidatus Peregrinibacteria bacterium CG10_big_fil_rev_8_21_14_0_10_36_19]